MEIKVQLNNLRVAPRKTRMVIDLIRNKNVADARNLLLFTVKRSADPVLKLLNSAAATARNDLKLDESNLYVSEVKVDGGPILKRMHPMSRGRGYPIMKRTSHITLILKERTVTKEEKKGKKEVQKPSKAKTKKA